MEVSLNPGQAAPALGPPVVHDGCRRLLQRPVLVQHGLPFLFDLVQSVVAAHLRCAVTELGRGRSLVHHLNPGLLRLGDYLHFLQRSWRLGFD